MTSHPKIVQNCYRILCILGLLYVLATPVYAGERFEAPITTEERAVMAFFRAAKVAPDYDVWIKSSDDYLSVPPSKRYSYFINESIRLGNGYGLFNLERDVLAIYVDVMALYIKPEDGKEARIQFRMLDVEEGNMPSFEFPFGEAVISLIINNLSVFQDLAIPEEKLPSIIDNIPYEDDEFNATLELNVRVRDADYGKPLIQDGKIKWVMVGDVAYARCNVDNYYSAQKLFLWDYVAPWYEEAYRIKTMPEEEKYPHPFDLFKD